MCITEIQLIPFRHFPVKSRELECFRCYLRRFLFKNFLKLALENLNFPFLSLLKWSGAFVWLKQTEKFFVEFEQQKTSRTENERQNFVFWALIHSIPPLNLLIKRFKERRLKELLESVKSRVMILLKHWIKNLFCSFFSVWTLKQTEISVNLRKIEFKVTIQSKIL